MSAINFFDKLTEETMGLDSSNCGDYAQDIVSYFKNKSLLYYELRFNLNLSSYRAMIKKTVVDFPANWGDFKNFKVGSSLTKITDNLLTKILKENFFKNNLVQSFILVNTGEKYFFLVCPEGEEELIKDLENIITAAKKQLFAA
jgi:hypothetical protein